MSGKRAVTQGTAPRPLGMRCAKSDDTVDLVAGLLCVGEMGAGALCGGFSLAPHIANHRNQDEGAVQMGPVGGSAALAPGRRVVNLRDTPGASGLCGDSSLAYFLRFVYGALCVGV